MTTSTFGRQQMWATSRPRPGRDAKLVVWHLGRSGAGGQLAAAAASAAARAGLPTSLVINETYRGRVEVADGVDAHYRSTMRSVSGRTVPDVTQIGSALRLARRLRQPDATWYFPMQHFMNPLIGRMIAGRATVVSSFHETGQKEGEDNRFVRSLTLGAISSTTMLVAHSRFVAEQLEHAYQVPFLVAQLPAYQLGAQPSAPNTLGPRDGPLRLLLYGRLLRYKGVDLLLDAVRLVQQRRPDAVMLSLLGRSPDYAHCIQQAVGADIEWRDEYIDDAELAKAIRWSDVVVAPYREASQSAVITCAFAEYRPVIATSVGGLPEQVADGQTGVLCTPTASALADAIERFVDDPGLAAKMSTTISDRIDGLGWKWLVEIARAGAPSRPSGSRGTAEIPARSLDRSRLR